MLTTIAPMPLTAPDRWFSPLWLAATIFISVALHIAIIFVQFVMPQDPAERKGAIEMILVNDYNQLKNEGAKVFANAALEGGGDAESGRKTSPLIREDEDKDGNSLQAQESRVAAMEQTMTQKLLATQKSDMREFNLAAMTPEERQEWQEAFDIIARRQAEIERSIQDYNARPRKYFDGPHTDSHEASMYVQQWKTRVEDWGNKNYPEQARGKIYGDVILTVEIDHTGRVLIVSVAKSSGHNILDRAAIDSVQRSGPFGAFTAPMKSAMDVLVLTRTWSYSTEGMATKNQF